MYNFMCLEQFHWIEYSKRIVFALYVCVVFFLLSTLEILEIYSMYVSFIRLSGIKLRLKINPIFTPISILKGTCVQLGDCLSAKNTFTLIYFNFV